MNQDPVCGVPVDEATALYHECDGKSFYFCSYFCRHQFLATSAEINRAEKGESPPWKSERSMDGSRRLVPG